MIKVQKYFYLVILTLLILNSYSYSEIINKIIVKGNERISTETIIIFSSVSENEEIENNKLNQILKDIYATGFFNDVQLDFKNNILIINVVENPIIQNISYNGIKSQTIKDSLIQNLTLKERSSFNENFLLEDKNRIIKSLKEQGYFSSKVDVYVEELKDNKVDVFFNIELGKKAKIKKISFIGNKIFKDNKLKRIIVSEEYKFWKFISGKKYLNENIVQLDSRLLKNYYLNNGYYNVKINSTLGKLIDQDNFELIFNIDAGEKIYFNDLNLNLPNDFNRENFKKLEYIFTSIKNEPYSLYNIQKILDEIDQITLIEEYQTINATLNEEIVANRINILFNIEKSEDLYVEKINIYGNSITKESVIRNKFLLDEGDPYNEILKNKTFNEIKALNFFSNVDIEVLDGINEKSKIINISVEEKATGEIAATAGISSAENSIGFTIKENNLLGRGILLDSNLILATDSIKGMFSLNNPNFSNSDKSLSLSLESSELDKFADFGYKTSKTGLSISTNFEYFNDLWLGLGISNYYQNIETDSTASEAQKKQRGDYFDSYLKLDFDYDKRNQKFQPSSGFRNFYSVDLPIISDTYTLINTYNYQYFTELYENNTTSISFYLKSVNSINGENVKLSERSYLPYSKLRGFRSGSIGPKDGTDYIGGNYTTAINFISTLPQLFEESQNTDFSFFIDIANMWGVDYDSSLDDSNKIRSSIGLALDWITPLGPLNFSLSQPITKASTDSVETFRFNLGTTF